MRSLHFCRHQTNHPRNTALSMMLMSAGNTAMTSAAWVSSISHVCFTVTSRSSTDEKYLRIHSKGIRTSFEGHAHMFLIPSIISLMSSLGSKASVTFLRFSSDVVQLLVRAKFFSIVFVSFLLIGPSGPFRLFYDAKLLPRCAIYVHFLRFCVKSVRH